MGRKRKYHTDDERHEAQKRWQMEYYYRNRESILSNLKEKYKKMKLINEKNNRNIYGE